MFVLWVFLGYADFADSKDPSFWLKFPRRYETREISCDDVGIRSLLSRIAKLIAFTV